MMLLGIDWFVVEGSRRKAAINVLFLCVMVVSLYVVGFWFRSKKKNSTLDPKIIRRV
jgi:hypothetical protein